MWTPLKHSRQLALAHSQLESVVLQRTAELQILSQRLLKVQDEERRKLSRDLHDSTGQTLTALKISVSFLEENCRQDPLTVARISEVAKLANQAIEEIRTMSYLLHPPLLDEVGLACAAEWFVEGFAKRSGLNVTLDIASFRERLPMRVEIALFRVLQESLTNVHRHSGASAVTVRLQYRGDEINLDVRDNGHGIPAERLARLSKASAEEGVGLAGMRERMNELNGKLEIESDAQGTIMRAIVSLPALPLSVRLGDSGQASASFQLNDGASTSVAANRQAICRPGQTTMLKGSESPGRRHALATRSQQQAQRVSWHKRSWSLDLAAVATVLALAGWLAYSDYRAPSFVAASDLQNTTASAEQVPLRLGNAAQTGARSPFRSVPIPVGDASIATQRLELVENEFIHLADDVTGRHLTPRPARDPVPTQPYQIVHIGNDVTVRYFTPQPKPHPFPDRQYQLVHMGEDVTVRHFTPSGRDSTQ
jgi:anti-sigma regulatory factor (Ser/Thr protein kinase)